MPKRHTKPINENASAFGRISSETGRFRKATTTWCPREIMMLKRIMIMNMSYIIFSYLVIWWIISKNNRKHYELYYVISVIYELMKKTHLSKHFPSEPAMVFCWVAPTHRWFWCSRTWHGTWTHSNALAGSFIDNSNICRYWWCFQKAGYIWDVTYPLHLPFFWIYRQYTSLSPTSWILILNHPKSF